MTKHLTSHRAAFTIDEWCQRRRMSRGSYYKLRKSGKAPRLHYALTKPLISLEADAEWQREREAEASGGADADR